MISEENLVESLQDNIMYPMVKQLHEYVKKHFVLFLWCQMDELPELFKLKLVLVVLLTQTREVAMNHETRQNQNRKGAH